METVKIDILNPKARKLLKNLDELNLISIRKPSESDFSRILDKLRSESCSAPGPEEIAHEVEAVRTERYDNQK